MKFNLFTNPATLVYPENIPRTGLYLYCCALILHVVAVFTPVPAHCEILLQDTVWEGEVRVEDDILIPRGVSLTIKKGSQVLIKSADGTRTDPEYMSPMTEITIRGRLVVEGTPDDKVVVQLDRESKDSMTWAGIIIDGGEAQVTSCTVRDAATGIWIIDGSLDIRDSTLSENRYGLVAQKESSRVELIDTRISGNDYGLMALNGAVINQKNTVIGDNRKIDFHSAAAPDPDIPLKRYEGVAKTEAVELVDEVILGDTIWQGRIKVTGQVRVPVESRLIILPGTVVEFTQRDTNGDGIGESGLMLQGVLVAKGTAKKPIIFRSAEPGKTAGSWDSLNIINSDGVRNIIEFCQVEDAYRGLHFHFSNVIVQNSVFLNNYRGVQFQESTVELRNNQFHENTSAIQARDSKIVFENNQVVNNVFGANFLRAHLTVGGNTFSRNLEVGLRIREGFPSLSTNIFHNNRFGLMFSDTTYGSVTGNLMVGNSETGLSIRAGANMEIKGNFIQGNSLSGISVRDTEAVIRGNNISANGERGIGLVSFKGPITENTFSDNRLYAIAVEDGSDVAASMNWYDRSDIDPIIYDQKDDATRGRVDYRPLLDEAELIQWPLAKLPFDLEWTGKIAVPATVSIPAGTTLSIKAGSGIFFGKDAGMDVEGHILAIGAEDQRIRFTAFKGKERNSWGEIRIEHSQNSRFSNCDFEYATWAIHSHFNALTVVGCTFRNSGGGIRFRSGPHLIKNCLFSENDIGLRSFRGNADIISNVITRNDKGIFVREKGGGLTITGNNIFENSSYNIWVGDFNRDDIQAPDNWWGSGDPAETIYDARIEPGIGTVLFEPVLSHPLEISFVDRKWRELEPVSSSNP